MYEALRDQLGEDIASAYRGRRVLIFGATGFIGRHVAGVLRACGAQVHVAVRDAGRASALMGFPADDSSIHAVDLSQPGLLDSVFAGAQPAVTFNLAGYGVDRSERDEQQAYQINDELVGGICDAMVQHRDASWTHQALIHVGSALEYGEVDGDLSETTDVHPTTRYGLSKLAGTRRLTKNCTETGLRGLTARLFTVYGPGEHEGRILPALLDAARTGSPLPLTAGTQHRDFTFVADVVEGLLRLGLCSTQPGEIVNLATGKLKTVREFVETAVSVLGLDPDQLQFGALPTRAEEMEHEPINIEKLRQATGWSPSVSIEQGIARTHTWENAP